MIAVTPASHQVQCSPRVTSLIAVTPSPPPSSSMFSIRRNAKIFTSYGQCGGPSTCRDENSCANSGDRSQKRRELPRISSIHFDMKKNASLIRTQSLEKVTAVLGETQRDMKRSRSPGSSMTPSGSETSEKIAIGVQSSKHTDQDEDCGNSSKFMEISPLASASWSFGRSSPSLWEFTEWANNNGRRLVEDNEVDGALVNNMNDSFFAGVQARVGERLMAELMSEVPEFSKTGRRTTPRVWRCLRGWRRLCPSRSRRPYPLPAWAAMANELTRQEYRLVAVALLLGLQTYLRPGGLVQLHKVDLIGAKKGVFWTAGT